ncbi:YggS family pyridoxal phosphate-dependent enzyme [Aureibaculum sp. A20]|uniref:Pyridoxal phosphate homeostasis protein n=1 Tax=Aureibaculum flavum TaxID=2795986 RepID=A0ABS0WL65_9FLAO|nr:YggS family pyridoxal phosphate-dependent enzyme [Aureibaculum flavum]MBJ2172708.1 YggS family pyridoxal phosphate-dependent enzyme [Aureibaculum flavum]
MSISENLKKIKQSLPAQVALVAVSKTKPNSAILEAYSTGQRIFGENRIQEMVDKYDALPKDIEWHMIGHLQRNKVKYMAHFVKLIHGVDSFKTLQEINKQAKKHNRVIHCLLQARIAEEDTKFGLPFTEIEEILSSKELEALENISITGLMGMATFTDNIEQIKAEFSKIKTLFEKLKTDHKEFTSLSIGMSGDYKLAIECGSTMVRVGSAIFGTRN